MGLYKRGGVWWMFFTCKGKQVRRSTETTNKELAGKIHAKVITQVTEGKWFERAIGADKTFREMAEKYEQERFSELACGSRRGVKGYLDGLVRYFGDYRITEISPRLISEFKQMRKSKGKKPATINRQLTVMRRIYNIAVREWEWTDSNPLTRVPSERVNNARDRWLYLEEEQKLLEAIPEWLREIVIFALNTGMRRGEILSLTHRGVNLKRRTIMVFQSKNGERRTIPLNKAAMAILRGRIRSVKTDHVFYTMNHTPHHPNNVGRDFKRYVETAGIKDFRFHDLRHTFATRLVQAGVDLYMVSKLLGHKDIRKTQRYSHHYPESLRDGVEVLDRAEALSQFYHNPALATKKEVTDIP